MTLLLALLCLAAPGEPSVRSVRIEGAPSERFLPYVDLVPGQPLDRAVVRRAVELIYATGEFEDVVVAAEAQADGVDVVFRLRPAPLFARVAILGDHVLSAAALGRMSGLRPKELLWPARLERAGRDAALALAARGYLEAAVSAEVAPGKDGATVLFRVSSGPRARVGKATLETPEPALRPLIQERLRPHPGDVYRKADALRAAENMRKRLVEAGRWRAAVSVEERYSPATALVDVTFAVTPGLFTQLELLGAPVSRSLEEVVRNLVRDGGGKGDALEAGGERLEEAFRRRGHRDVAVRHRFETRPWGEALVYEIRPGPAATVASVRVVGDMEPAPTLQTREGLPLDERVLDDDARTIARLLEERGHAEARVETEVPEGGGALPVVFQVRPGPRTLVRSVSVKGVPKGTTVAPLRLRPGGPYRLRDLAMDRSAVLNAARNAGFLGAEVRPVLAFSEDRTEVEVVLEAAPGRRTDVDHVVVAGLDRTRDVVVRREMKVAEGEPLGQDRILQSQRRLSALGIFERVTLSELDPERADRRDVVVTVREAPVTTLSYGLGYAERDLLRASVEATRRNLFGMDRSLSAFGRASFKGSRFLLSYREPYLLGRRRELFATGFWEEEDRTTFDFNRLGALLQTAWSLGPKTSLIARYVFQKTQVFRIEVPIEEVDRQFRNYNVSGPSASVVFDTRDDPLEPHRGRFLGADLQLSVGALGGDSFMKGFFQSATYERLGARTVLALSARLGLGRTLGTGEPLGLPFPERFFAGGDFGPRGFKVDTLGPLAPGTDGALFPTGGNALVLGGAELRTSLSRAFSLGTFVDVGNVYTLVRDIDLGDLRYSAGLGLRYKTPLGPLRVDWGYKLNRQAGESPYRFHFTIGNAF